MLRLELGAQKSHDARTVEAPCCAFATVGESAFPRLGFIWEFRVGVPSVFGFGFKRDFTQTQNYQSGKVRLRAE